jgi:D-amino-acid dehydrogenase
MKTALADHQELARRAGISGHMRRTGALHVFDTDSSFQSGLAEWREREQHGVVFREIPASEARKMVPALKGTFARVLIAPDYWTVSSPLHILQGLRARIAEGGAMVASSVDAIRAEPDRIVVSGGGREAAFDRVVVAGGVWSRDLVRRLGLSVLLETERGYNTTWAEPPVELPMPVFFSDRAFVATPLDDGLRLGGAVELAAVDSPPNYARAAAIRQKTRRYIPDLPEVGGREWMGQRPSTPDSLPVIGAPPGERRIVFAFGHGHLGLTLSAVTARHAAGLVAGRTPEDRLKAFGIERFQ